MVLFRLSLCPALKFSLYRWTNVSRFWCHTTGICLKSERGDKSSLPSFEKRKLGIWVPFVVLESAKVRDEGVNDPVRQTVLFIQ